MTNSNRVTSPPPHQLTLPTQSQDAGSFADFDLCRVPSPCFVVDLAKIRANLSTLRGVRDRSGARVLCALKAFSMWRLGGLISESLDGVCASGLWEARLARAHYQGELTTYSAGYHARDIDEIATHSDHLIFNSAESAKRFATQAAAMGCSIGVRVNPHHSEGLISKYDPCAPGSRLGLPIERLDELLNDPSVGDLIRGIHLHTLCEQDFPPLERTWTATAPYIRPHYHRLDWINLGGGHHITRADYQVDDLCRFLSELHAESEAQLYLEPGEAVAFEAGILVGEVLDVMKTDRLTAILDLSATCHMPDVIEAPYRPALLGELPLGEGVLTRLGGPSCLAGDLIGEYRFRSTPEVGDRLCFLDQAHYSMVKTNTFNGVPLPSIALWDSQTDELEVVRSFDWTEFERRLS